MSSLKVSQLCSPEILHSDSRGAVEARVLNLVIYPGYVALGRRHIFLNLSIPTCKEETAMLHLQGALPRNCRL